MAYSLWDKEDLKVRKETFKSIGEDVFSFFLDLAPNQGFEEREGQWVMSCEIVQSMQDKKHLLVEAGVGIGKSFAYIVPLLYYHKRYKKPIIIATSTIALQEQLAKDIEIIESILKYYPEIAIAKGQNHFLCRNRFEEYFFGKDKDSEEYNVYLEIEKGGYEKTNWNMEISDDIWKKINVREYNPVFCRQKCPYKNYCFYYKLRMEMLNTQGFILCNQDLLAMNMRKRRSCSKELLTDKFEYVIVDEVHNLESRVRNSYTSELSYIECTGAIEQARKVNSSLGNTLDKNITRYYKALDAVFLNFQSQISKQDAKAKNDDREIERYSVSNKISELAELINSLNDIYLGISMQFGMEVTYRSRNAEDVVDKIEGHKDFFESLQKISSEDIFWMNIKGRGKNGIIVSKCPKNVNRLTEQLFFNDSDFKTILTSATLTSGKSECYEENYNYFIANINYPVKSGVVCEPKISPFDYKTRAMIYYTENMPHPSKNRRAFIDAGVKEIIKLLDITEGKALILFTAKRDMQEVYRLLKEHTSYKVLIQSNGASQNEVLKEFKKDVNSVLLGAGSYWEGISIEGKTLSNLIIFKLPFPVPEPIIDYKRSISEDALMEVSVPEMVIKLKQGIGRLIRNKQDSGIVSIIDSRVGDMSTVPYKDTIWESLPIDAKTNDINTIKEFYSSLG